MRHGPALYHGETNRNGYSRNKEHINASVVETVEGIGKSFIATHYWKHHDGEHVGMKMKMTHSFRGDPTARQCAEAIMIKNTNENRLMNSKNEFLPPINIKEKYELPTGSWADKQREKLTNAGRHKFRNMLADKLNKNKIGSVASLLLAPDSQAVNPQIKTIDNKPMILTLIR